MKFVIEDPSVGRLVVAFTRHQKTYPNSRSFERVCGLEKVQRDLRRFAVDALLRGEAELVLPTSEDLRRELGDLRALEPKPPR